MRRQVVKWLGSSRILIGAVLLAPGVSLRTSRIWTASAEFEGFTLGGAQVQGRSQPSQRLGIRKAAGSALQIRDSARAQLGTVGQAVLSEAGPQTILAQEAGECLKPLRGCAAGSVHFGAEHSTVCWKRVAKCVGYLRGLHMEVIADSAQPRPHEKALNRWLIVVVVGLASLSGRGSAMATRDSGDTRELLGRDEQGLTRVALDRSRTKTRTFS